jgi:hypothetical protein
LGIFCAFSYKILMVNDALACSFINFIQNWEKSFYGYSDEIKFSSENLIVYEFITWSFLDMCLFIVLFVTYWNDKNYLILSSIKVELCFDKKNFCSVALMLDILRCSLFVVLILVVFLPSKCNLIFVDDIQNRSHISLFF